MQRKIRISFCAAVMALFATPLLKAAPPQIESGAWTPAGTMAEARDGASEAFLPDGRVLITGGNGPNGPLATSEFFDIDGTFSAAAPMNVARSNHISVVLRDGRVLVAGGSIPGGGATNAAEIYDPTSNSWLNVAGGMVEARSGHSATILRDGRVLIAGGVSLGVVSSTLEVFDPKSNTFSFAGQLSSPRVEHAAGVLDDGRVLIIGGSNGSASLASVDIYDPDTKSIKAGPALSTPRAGLSATVLMDGTILVAGGNNGSSDLASAEIFNPAAEKWIRTASLSTPRRNHLAFRLPNNNGVLIAGGTSAGTALSSAELYLPWDGVFKPTGSMAAERVGAVGSPLGPQGLLLVSGGSKLASAELYGFATVKTDRGDYAPGETVTITGSGWQPAETVTLLLQEVPKIHKSVTLTATADSAGNIFNNQWAPDKHDFGVLFYLSAKGSRSEAQNEFTDAGPQANIDQCRNGGVGLTPVPCVGTAWANGNAGSSNAHYLEGDSIPYRARVTNLTAGASYSLSIQWDTSQNGKHALDYLTSFNRTEITANACSDLASVNCADVHTFPVPSDPNVSAAGVTQISGQQFTAYGGTITGVSPYTLNGDYTGNSSTGINVTFTADANGTVVLAWGGHISTRIDWGFNSSAVSIAGSPYHMRLIGFTCSNASNCGVGNQDRSVSSAAVIFPASITIAKHANPPSNQSFSFTGTPNPPVANFPLIDDSDTTDPSQVFAGLTNFGTYTFTESVPTSWKLESISCGPPTGGTGGTSTTSSGSTLTINLAEGDNVTCTFNNNEDVGRIVVKKVTNPATDTSTSFTFTPTGYNGDSSFSLVNGGTNMSEALQSGTYSVTETAIPAGWDFTSLSCVTSGAKGSVGTQDSSNATQANINLKIGDTVTCTFTNTQRGHIIVKKVTDPVSDTTTSFTFTPSYNGGATFVLKNGGTNDSGALVPSSYSVSEALLADWDQTGATCDNGKSPSRITLGAGQTITCTFTNTRQTGTLTVNKVLTPSSDLGRFNLQIDGSTAGTGGNVGDGGTTGAVTVITGTHTVGETAVTGTQLSIYVSSISCSDGTTVVASGSGPGPLSVVVGSKANIICTIINSLPPNLIIAKTPDTLGDPGYEIGPGDIASFTIAVSNIGPGPAEGVVLTDTLPSGVGNWTDDQGPLCTITGGVNLSCNIPTLPGGAAFSVTLQATIPTNYLLPPTLPPGDSSFEIDGNLAVDTTGNMDWANSGISCTSTPKVGCDLDKPTGTTDDSFGQGTKEDTAVPSIVTGGIPNTKSDLTRFYVAHEKASGTDFLYLAWERTQAPSGSTNMDFELNQSRTLSSNGVTPIRTAGDLLIKYDLDNGGTVPTLGYHVWVTEASAEGKTPNEACEASTAFPCWGKVHALTTDIAGAVNMGSVQDPILAPGQTSPRTLDPVTFGEALIDLQANNIFPASITDPSQCVSFGQAYLKSRSSSSFTAEIKDFVAPIASTISNCPAKYLNNQAFAQASNFGQVSDTGQIKVKSIPPPEAMSVTPNTGSGQGPMVFSYLYSDAAGYQNITNAYVLVNATQTWTGSCGIMYVSSSNTLYMARDTGSGWLGPATIGHPGTLQNSQCTLDPSASSVNGSGIDLTLNLALSFQPSFTNLKHNYMRASDSVHNLDSGWEIQGNWIPSLPATPSAVSVTPSSGSGTSQTFTYLYSDASGYQNISTVFSLLNTTLSYASSCATMYLPASHNLYLVKDGGSGWLGPVTLGQAGTLQNSQCTVNAGASSAGGSGTNLTVNLAVSFQPNFVGLKSHYMRAVDNINNLDSGWQNRGTWTPSP
jgi:uncharacterized repeat protein (TIGR01451 family)